MCVRCDQQRSEVCADWCLLVEVEGIYLLTSGVPDQPADVVCSYLEEASAGHRTRLHVTLFSVDESDVAAAATTNGAGDDETLAVLPCRYANVSQTAHVLRDMAHSTVGGRFHSVRETGMRTSVLYFIFGGGRVRF